eukprot:CAMPEP_0117581482 /NCGR_PEP_ID=MMETSP0784-20121206/65851_1 /TAXON_ID=39447 /ORGANISM="" /LENGTH=493 /DNA_ID=CAMNT_0005381797 /DNA_START=123 /DNA_END=1604 /DNA_ORIENTATION=+
MDLSSGRELARNETVKFSHVFTEENEGCIHDHYDFEKKLGEGSYGRVMRGKEKKTSEVRAIKAISLGQKKESFEIEVAIQRSLDHPNIVKLYDIFRDAKYYYLVMELCTGGELFDAIIDEASRHEGSAFDERQAATYMHQILAGILFMHSKGIAHRDLKPENFLLQKPRRLDRNAPLKIIDFGLAKQFGEPDDNGTIINRIPLVTKAGTAYYVAPEVLRSGAARGYDERCDVWSCGVLAYILICGYPPFAGENDVQTLDAVKRAAFDFPPEDWADVSGDAKNLIQAMLTKDPNDRPAAEALMTHPWFVSHVAGPAGTMDSKVITCDKLRRFKSALKLKKLALTLIAQLLPERDIQHLRETFKMLDKNSDGTLTIVEITEEMTKQGLHDEAMEELLRSVDSDGSGRIDYTEFIAATLTNQEYMKKSVLWTAFCRFDRNGDGVITKDELHQLCKDERLTDVMMKEADTNQSGDIDFEEFCKVMGTEVISKMKAEP